MMEGNEHRFLKTACRIFGILGWIALVIGFIATLVILLGGGGPETPRAAGVVGIFLGAIYFLIFKTVGGIIRILLDIESRLKP